MFVEASFGMIRFCELESRGLQSLQTKLYAHAAYGPGAENMTRKAVRSSWALVRAPPIGPGIRGKTISPVNSAARPWTIRGKVWMNWKHARFGARAASQDRNPLSILGGR